VGSESHLHVALLSRTGRRVGARTDPGDGGGPGRAGWPTRGRTGPAYAVPGGSPVNRSNRGISSSGALLQLPRQSCNYHAGPAWVRIRRTLVDPLTGVLVPASIVNACHSLDKELTEMTRTRVSALVMLVAVLLGAGAATSASTTVSAEGVPRCCV
jgi:hypothetical protein